MGDANLPRIPIIVGPTAVGKTSLVYALASQRPVVVISADSRQVYRGLDVGTAKPSVEMRRRVPHRGVDIVDIGERYSAGRFARDAHAWLAEAAARRQQLCMVVGGTGLYVRALVDGLFHEPSLDPSRRRALRTWTARFDRASLARWAARLDPGYTGGGAQRASRVIEIGLLTGRPLSWWQRAAQDSSPLRPWYVHLTLPRAVLHRRIEVRTARMVAGGLVDEARAALAAGHPATAPGLDAIGYREATAVLEGRLAAADLPGAVARVTRQYAKRQITWFRNQLSPKAVWSMDASRPAERLAAEFWARWDALEEWE